MTWQNYLLATIAFLAPIWTRSVGILVSVFCVLSLYNLIKGYTKPKFDFLTVLVLAFYLLFVIGVAYTDNTARALFDLQLKFTLVAFAVAFLGYNYNDALDSRGVLKFFVFGVTIATALSLFQSLYKIIFNGMAYYHLLGARFSVLMHQTYFAMYLNMAIIVKVVLSWKTLIDRKSPGFKSAATNVGFLVLGVVLAGSKTGFIMLAVNLIGVFIAQIRTFEKKWMPIVIGLSTSIIIGLMFVFVPFLNHRITNMISALKTENVSPTAVESTKMRTLIYKSAKDIIKHQPWYGQGTGDFQDVLDSEYVCNGYEHLYEQHLNAHNLFYQVWLAIGIPGLVALIIWIGYILMSSILRREYIYLGFGLLFLIIALTESALYVQAGVSFFALFTLMLAKNDAYSSSIKSLS